MRVLDPLGQPNACRGTTARRRAQLGRHLAEVRAKIRLAHYGREVRVAARLAGGGLDRLVRMASETTLDGEEEPAAVGAAFHRLLGEVEGRVCPPQRIARGDFVDLFLQYGLLFFLLVGELFRFLL